MGTFHFKAFSVSDDRSAMKTGTDGVLLGAWAEAPEGVASVIDIGAGSGLISLMMAQRYPHARIHGVEIDAGAVADARFNAGASPWADRIEITEADASAWAPSLPGPRLIVSNPPFFSETLRSPSASRAMARHDGALNPLSLIRIAERLMTSPSDRLAFIAPSARSSEIEFELSVCGLSPLEVCSVSTRAGKAPVRTLWSVARGVNTCLRTDLAIREADNSYSSPYIALTSPFYLHLKA